MTIFLCICLFLSLGTTTRMEGVSTATIITVHLSRMLTIICLAVLAWLSWWLP